jgi:shikimate kinase
VALVGFMAAGKTRVGTRLSELTGMPFHDIDLLIERMVQLPVHRIFQERGEPYFRSIEAAVLRDLCRGSGQIIGCGGGTVLSEENRVRLRERCVTVWLRASEREILGRLEDPESPRRPLLEGVDPEEVVARLLGQREPLYAAADCTVETDARTVEAIAREIAFRLGLPIFEA